MWLLWRRLGTEGYYAGLDKQFGSLQQNINALEVCLPFLPLYFTLHTST